MSRPNNRSQNIEKKFPWHFISRTSIKEKLLYRKTTKTESIEKKYAGHFPQWESHFFRKCQNKGRPSRKRLQKTSLILAIDCIFRYFLIFSFVTEKTFFSKLWSKLFRVIVVFGVSSAPSIVAQSSVNSIHTHPSQRKGKREKREFRKKQFRNF